MKLAVEIHRHIVLFINGTISLWVITQAANGTGQPATGPVAPVLGSGSEQKRQDGWKSVDVGQQSRVLGVYFVLFRLADLILSQL